MVGFIGCGNMATAIISGMISSGFLDGGSIGVYDIDKEKTEALSRKYLLRVFTSECELIENCTTVVVAVKPNVFPSLFEKVGNAFEKYDPLIISIAAGKTIGYITSLLNYEPRVVRIMPNINAKVCQAISAYCGSDRVVAEDLSFVNEFCNSFGMGIEISESLFSAYSSVGGCAPAFSYMFIDSLARAAVKNGMPKNMALTVAAQTVLGSAKMIIESGSHPWQLIDEVCSPGGTTVEGVVSLQESGFESSVIKAVDSSYNKDRKI